MFQRVRVEILLLLWGCVSALELLDVEPGLKCSCDLASTISFTAIHARNSSGHWNTEIAVERGICSANQQPGKPTGLITGERVKPPAVGYELFPAVGSYYKHHTGTQTWENARHICEQEGAHLAIINSEEEATILSLIYQRTPRVNNAKWEQFAFIGFHDIYDEGTYVTIFGEPLATLGFGRIWNKGEGDLNNMGQSDTYSGQDCGTIHRNGGLNDLNCELFASFFCEKELGIYPPRGLPDYSAGMFRSLKDEVKPRNGTMPRQKPGPGYELFDKIGFYKFHTTPTNWEHARHICHSEGGHLAIVNSDVEAMVLTTMFKRIPALKMTANNNFALIGFHDIYLEGQYLTIYGEPLVTQGYVKWRPGTPDNAGHSAVHPGQDCGSINREGYLDDIDCEYHYAFFCEQELMV